MNLYDFFNGLKIYHLNPNWIFYGRINSAKCLHEFSIPLTQPDLSFLKVTTMIEDYHYVATLYARDLLRQHRRLKTLRQKSFVNKRELGLLFLRSVPQITREELQELTGVSSNTLSNYLCSSGPWHKYLYKVRPPHNAESAASTGL